MSPPHEPGAPRRISAIFASADLALSEVHRAQGGPLSPEAELIIREQFAHFYRMGAQGEIEVRNELAMATAQLARLRQEYRALLKRISDSRSEE